MKKPKWLVDRLADKLAGVTYIDAKRRKCGQYAPRALNNGTANGMKGLMAHFTAEERDRIGTPLMTG